jgi:hypothetical protein
MVFEIGEHEIEFGTDEQIHTLLRVSGDSPLMFFGQGILFSHCLGLCLGEVGGIPDFFLKEETLFYANSHIDLDHFNNEERFFFAPSIHVFEKFPFHFPSSPQWRTQLSSLRDLRNWIRAFLKLIQELLDNVEVIVLGGGFEPNFTADYRNAGPEIEDYTVWVDVPISKFVVEFFSYSSALELRDRLNIADSDWIASKAI